MAWDEQCEIESYLDDEYTCPECEERLSIGYIDDDGYGSSIRFKTKYCPNCGWETRVYN